METEESFECVFVGNGDEGDGCRNLQRQGDCPPRRRTVRPAPRGSTRCCRPCTAHARDAALKRGILIADHVTWAVPVLLTLFLLRVEGRSDNAGLIKRRLEELNARRDKALRHDTLPLRRYGWQLTVLARRLRQLMERATGGSPFQLSLAPRTSATDAARWPLCGRTRRPTRPTRSSCGGCTRRTTPNM